MATPNNSISSFGAFPELVINQGNVFNSWRTFSQDFWFAFELRELELDTRYTNPRTKVVALL